MSVWSLETVHLDYHTSTSSSDPSSSDHLQPMLHYGSETDKEPYDSTTTKKFILVNIIPLDTIEAVAASGQNINSMVRGSSTYH